MKILKLLFSKATIILFSIVLQVVSFFILLYSVNLTFKLAQIITYVLGIVIFLIIINKDTKPDNKLPWISIVLIVPLFGIIIYLLFANIKISKKHQRIYLKVDKFSSLLVEDQSNFKMVEQLGEYYGQSLSLTTQSGFPPFSNSKVSYFNSGESFFESLLIDLKEAKEFIFMEYFIIKLGFMWNSILDVLVEKVNQGVDVRVLYDDFGCMWKLKNNYYKKLRKLGIKCYKFNKFNPTVSNIHNYRDHRKITVIDGNVAYTGGINISDEYINKNQKLGHWKDSAVKIEGQATKSFTLMFLQNYSLMANRFDEDFSRFINKADYAEADGIVQPFGSDAKKLVSEIAIKNLINQSKRYIYITTPYLICDYSLLEAIKQASYRGVDVRLVLPNNPDKKLIWYMSRSNFKSLILSGVKIYQYTPGFIHQKVILCDDDLAIVGTINLDNRSLIHHSEDGVFMYKTQCLKDISKDFEQIFDVSELQTEKSAKLNIFIRLFCAVAKIFTPLM